MSLVRDLVGYRFPQLVRVIWTDKKTRQRKSFSAARLARHEEDAFTIAQAIEFCMVPLSAQRIVYQVSDMNRKPTGRDAKLADTTWRTFWKEQQ